MSTLTPMQAERDSAEYRSMLFASRAVLATLAVAYPAWHFLIAFTLPQFADPLGERFVVAALAVGALLLTLLDLGRKQLERIGEAMALAVSLHFLTLVDRAQCHVWTQIGLLIVLTGCNLSMSSIAAVGRFTSVVALASAVVAVRTGIDKVEAQALIGDVLGLQLFACVAGWRRARFEDERRAEVVEQARLLSLVLDTVPEPLSIRDDRGQLLLANRALLGLSTPERSPKLLQASRGLEQLALDTTQPVRAELLTEEHGELRVWQAVASQLQRADGQRLVVALATDITAERERDILLIEARDAAEAGLRAKGEFLAKMSHEIGTPFGAVQLALDLAAEASTPAERAELLQVARSGTAHLRRIVDDILDASRIESGQLRLEAVSLDLHALLDEVCALHRLVGAERGLWVRLDIEPGVPQWLLGDPLRLRQVLGNLLSNGVKFTEHGGVLVRASLTAETPAQLLLTVRDTGAGIPAARQQAVLEPFVQADDATSRRHGGTGLGLAIVRQLVELMGGSLQLQSAPQLGSTFSVRLPLRLGEAPKTPPARLATEGISPARRVLVVDDNPLNCEVARHLLTQLGHSAVLAASATAAEPLLDASIDLVLLDLQLPEVDGWQACRNWRSRGIAVPIWAVTATSPSAVHDSCLSAGMQGCLGKPLDRRLLGEVLAALP